MIGILFGRIVALLAFAAGAAHEQLDRAARKLAGGPDAVDQHAAEARTLWIGQGPFEQAETFRRIRQATTPRRVEVLDDCTSGWTLSQALRRFYGGDPHSDGDDLAAILAADGVMLARRSG